jgi:hypothetical protein
MALRKALLTATVAALASLSVPEPVHAQNGDPVQRFLNSVFPNADFRSTRDGRGVNDDDDDHGRGRWNDDDDDGGWDDDDDDGGRGGWGGDDDDDDGGRDGGGGGGNDDDD